MKINKTFIRFVIVGVANTVFGTAVMFLAYNLLHFNYWASSAANYIFGSILSFFLNKYYTFQSKDKSWGEVLRFIVNIGVCYLVAYGIARPMVRNLLSDAGQSIQDNCAMAAGMVLFVVINYAGQRLFVFQKK